MWLVLLLMDLALAAPPAGGRSGSSALADHLVLGFGGGAAVRLPSDPLAAGGEVWARLGVTAGAVDVAVECGRIEANTRLEGVYYQEWSPRLDVEWRIRHGRAFDPFLGLGLGAERVRGASTDPDQRGASPFVHNPAWAPLGHLGGGFSANLLGPAFVRVDARAFLPYGPQVAGGASLRPALEGLLSLEIRPGAHIDHDQDGLWDVNDTCPRLPEDMDGRGDGDGCPDVDDDHDGVLEPADRCATRPEDVDGFEDHDGCPDLDNDLDGTPDVSDRCPGEGEDPDDFSDDDGCPDLDNDQDGIPDLSDACINDPETPNGLDDGDGCPDRK